MYFPKFAFSFFIYYNESLHKKIWLTPNMSWLKIVIFNLEFKTAVCSSNQGILVVFYLTRANLLFSKIKLQCDTWFWYAEIWNCSVGNAGSIRKICNSIVSFGEVWYRRDISTLSYFFKVLFHSCHICKISAGICLSQSMFCFHRIWITSFDSITDGDKIPNGSNIELTKLKMPCFVLGTSLLMVLIFKTSCFGSQSALELVQ